MSGKFAKGQGFIDLTGNRFGALEVLEALGQDKHRRMKWKCLCDCGNFTEEFGAEMKHGNVKSCGCKLEKKRPRRVDFQEFLRRSAEAHGDRYDYSLVEYKNTSTPVDIVCREHGVFIQHPTRHYLQGQGCPKCAYEEKSKSKLSNTQKFIESAVQRNGGYFDYSKVSYVNSRTEIEIGCRKCSKTFLQRADVHLRGSGCPWCVLNARSDSYKLNTEEYVERATRLFGEQYDYTLTNYKYSKDRVDVKCNTCEGIFSIRADTHLRGHGCPCKATHGFDFTRPGTFYILECGDLTKIGITSHDVSKRVRDVSLSYGRSFELVHKVVIEDPRRCSDIETVLLRELRVAHKQPLQKFDGYTECFYGVNHASLLDRLVSLIKEYDD